MFLLKMAAAAVGFHNNRRNLRRNRVFRDRTNPLDNYDCVDLYKRYRFRRQDILDIVDEVSGDIEVANRGFSVPAVLQVLTALRFFATGSFQLTCADLAGFSQPTASRIINRVTVALLRLSPDWIVFPDQLEADRQKLKFVNNGGCPTDTSSNNIDTSFAVQLAFLFFSPSPGASAFFLRGIFYFRCVFCKHKAKASGIVRMRSLSAHAKFASMPSRLKINCTTAHRRSNVPIRIPIDNGSNVYLS